MLLQIISKRPPIKLARPLSTTLPKKAVPPILIALFKPASRILAMVVGRRARKWWQKLPEETKNRFRAKREKQGRILGFSSVFLAALAGIGYQSHLEECELTGRKKFIALRANQVEKMAEIERDDVSYSFIKKSAIILIHVIILVA